MGFDEVRTAEEAKRLEQALKDKDGDALLLIFADWCGHCTTYKPLWKKLAAMAKAKKANGVLTAAVHFDQKDNIPALKDAKLEGYPTVIRVKTDGSVETVPSADMRDEVKMKALLQARKQLQQQQQQQQQASAQKRPQLGLIVGAQSGGLRRRKSLRPPVSRKQRQTRRRNTRRAHRRF
jgi:thiol-disulfide isomerase/thioredoxin